MCFTLWVKHDYLIKDKWEFKLNIKTRLMIIPLSIIILSLVTVTTLNIVSSRNSALEKLAENQASLVESIILLVNEYIQEHKNIVTLLRDNETVKDTSEYENIDVQFRGLSDKEALAIRKLFKDTINIYPTFAYLETFTPVEAINVVLEPYQAQLDISEENYYKGFAYRDWYHGAIKNNDTYVSEAYISASIMMPVVAISTPIFNESRDIIAILIGAVELQELSKIVSDLSYGQSGHTYIVDKNGSLVAHPNQKYFLEDILHNASSQSIVKEVLSHTETKGSFIVYDQTLKEDVYVYYEKIQSSNWYVISQQTVAEATSHINDITNNSIAIMTIVLILTSLFLYFNAHTTIVALSELTKVSRFLSEEKLSDFSFDQFGNYPYRNDEIGLLFSTYKKMVEELMSYNEKMEATIEKRTRALSNSNHNLKVSIKFIEEQKKELLDTNEKLRISIDRNLETQKELIEAQKMASLGNLVSGIAHEINTPVGVAITTMSYLRKLTQEAEASLLNGELKKSDLLSYYANNRSALEMILKDLEQSAKMIEDFKLLSFNFVNKGHEKFNLGQQLEGIVAKFKVSHEDSDLRIELDCSENIFIESYPKAIYQILMNLLSNTVTHGFDSLENALVNIIVSEHENEITLKYSDNGKGISEEDYLTIYEPFYTTKRGEGHPGLGLHIVYNMVTQLLHGTIYYKNNEFTIQFPKRQ